MPSGSVWSDICQFNKSEIQLNLTGTGWKNLMNNCLMQTDISRGKENKSEGCVNVDPNVVMNMRHKMIKELSKSFPTPREQTRTEAFKLLREEYHDRLLKHKEEKLVETEIKKLRQILENHRLVIKEKLQQTEQKAKVTPNRTRLLKPHRKLPCDALQKMESWLGCSRQMFVETKISQKEIPREHAVQTKNQQQAEIVDLVSSRKGSLIEGEGEQKFWEEEEEEEEEGGKDEIMRRFLENGQESPRDDVKEEEKVDEAKKVPNGGVNRQGIRCALKKKWKNCGGCKDRQTENKIETFLSRLKEEKIKEEKKAVDRVESKVRRKIAERREKGDQTEEKLKKLMQEVKSSQKEAQQKLQEGRVIVKTEDKFLLRMEDRRKERMKRRKAFEERKVKMEEEKENMQRQKEEEKKQKDDQEKRKRLEELKEKRRAEKEKKEEERREREKMKVSTGLAVAHCRVYLLRGYGLRPWVKLMRLREWQQQEADKFFERRLKERTLRGWIARVREETELKMKCAAAFYEGMLKKNWLTVWIEAWRGRLRQNQVAADWYDLRIMETSFKRWLEFTKAEQLEYQTRRDLAARHHQRKLKLKYLKNLRDYPILKKLEEAKEKRKWKWRQKVKEILPDYEPVHVSENY